MLNGFLPIKFHLPRARGRRYSLTGNSRAVCTAKQIIAHWAALLVTTNLLTSSNHNHVMYQKKKKKITKKKNHRIVSNTPCFYAMLFARISEPHPPPPPNQNPINPTTSYTRHVLLCLRSLFNLTTNSLWQSCRSFLDRRLERDGVRAYHLLEFLAVFED